MFWWLFIVAGLLVAGMLFTSSVRRRARRLEQAREAHAHATQLVRQGQWADAISCAAETIWFPSWYSYNADEAKVVSDLLELLSRALREEGTSADYLLEPAIKALRAGSGQEASTARWEAIRVLTRSLAQRDGVSGELRELLDDELLRPASLPGDDSDEQHADELTDAQQSLVDRLGRLLFDGKYAAVIDIVDAELQEADGAFRAALFNRRGSAYLLRGEQERACSDFEAAVDLAPSHSVYQENLESAKSS